MLQVSAGGNLSVNASCLALLAVRRNDLLTKSEKQLIFLQ